ncbi:MAG: HU family DNA-binding protein [Magnetococcales bacterium]|nr:HU family DNA-binding protein [Magnetococcales bacterium]
MNKADLVAHVAKAAGMTQVEAEKAISAVVATIQETLVKGEQVTLLGFGSFSVTDRAAKTGRNPRTGEAIQVAACRVPHFRAGQTLKDAVSLKSATVPTAIVAADTVDAAKPKQDAKKKK